MEPRLLADEAIALMMSRHLERIKDRQGPVVWCKKCSRRHRRREVCKLYLRQRVAKSGRVVKRWCH